MPKQKKKAVDPFVQVTFSSSGVENPSDSATLGLIQNAAILADETPKILQWSEPETRLLLKVMSIIYTPLFRCKENRVRGIMYDKAFAFFKQKLEEDDIGSDTFRTYVTKAKMKDKWAEMKKGFQDMYIAALSNKTLDDHPRKKWPYFDDMAEILKEDKAAFPNTSSLTTEQQNMTDDDLNPMPKPLTPEDIIDKGKYTSDLYIFRKELEEQVVNHSDCTIKKPTKSASKSANNTKNNSTSQRSTMVETPTHPAQPAGQPVVHYTNVAPHFFQMVDSIREVNREHIINTRALFEEMQTRTASERLKRKADMEEFENRYITRRRMDEERMDRLLASQREIIDIVQGLLGNSRKGDTNRQGN